jgi:glycosyltransferase involved in cell wall biosynthesis
MVVLHAGRIGSNKMDGVNVAVPALVAAQNGLDGVTSALLVSAGSGPTEDGLEFPIFHYDRATGVAGLPTPFCKPDIAILHDTYIIPHRRIARQLQALGVPYILVPHGGLTRWAQGIKPIKKIAANLLFFNAVVNGARAVHCLTENEKTESLMTWQRPMFVIGNGTEIPPSDQIAQPGAREAIRFTFIGRLDPNHKGLDLLVEACSIIHSILVETGAEIKLYGPDYRGGEQVIAQHIARVGVGDVVELCGPVLGDAKVEVLRNADVFIHTSRSEGHPLAVLEALAQGVPCLLTPGTNISADVANAGAGWKAQSSAESIAERLAHIIKNRVDVIAAGQQAREFAITNCSWTQIAVKTVEAYEELLDHPFVP